MRNDNNHEPADPVETFREQLRAMEHKERAIAILGWAREDPHGAERLLMALNTVLNVYRRADFAVPPPFQRNLGKK